MGLRIAPKLHCALLVLAATVTMLVGCIVATKYETLRGIPSQNYSGQAHKGKYTEIHRQKNDRGYPYLLTLGHTKIYFATIRLSDDVVSAGVMLPIIPILDKPADYSDDYLKIRILAWPEKDVITFYPNMFQLSVNKTDDRLLPVAVIKEKSYGGYINKQSADQDTTTRETSLPRTIRKTRVDAANVWPIYTLVFDIQLHDVKEFVLIPGPMYIGEDAYMLPDIDYKRYIHTEFD